MAKSTVELRWEVDNIKVILLTVYNPLYDADLIEECYRLYAEHVINYNEVVIFFFRSGDLLDIFIELFLGHNKSEEDALVESCCYAKFIGSTLTFKAAVEDIEYEKLLSPISISQRIGIDEYQLKKFAES